MASPDETHDTTGDPQAVQESESTVSQGAVAPNPAPVAPRPQAGPRPGFVSREERDRRRKEALAGLTIGEWREGKVTGIAAFGAFVDLGGVDGLVHVSQLGTGGYVERVEDVVQVGQVVRVRVVEVEAERGRVSLSMREPRASAPPRERSPLPPRGDRPAAAAPPPVSRAPRPAPSFTPPVWGEPPPESGRPERRSRGNDRSSNARDERPARRTERGGRRGREGGNDEEWRHLRGDPRGYLSVGDEESEEPAPTTAEELVARFNRREHNR